MKYIIMFILIIVLTSCGGGGGTGSSGPGTVLPVSDSSTVQGTYCSASTTIGVDRWILEDAVQFLDGIAPSVQDFIAQGGFVYIVFDGTPTGYYEYGKRTIHISEEIAPLHRRLLHEYVHSQHLDYKVNEEPWLLETVAKGSEVYFGLWEKPESCDYSQIFNATDYTSQCNFACYLMEEYGNMILWDIVHCNATGVKAVELCTGNSWDSIMEDWKQW